jgi:hypothetical protein
VTILNYLDIIDYRISMNVRRFSYDHGINEYYYFLDDIGMELSIYYNNKIAILLISMIIADVVYNIKNGKKPIAKFILYGILTAIIIFIGFVASPEFYDSV